jgi:hypothetical protein
MLSDFKQTVVMLSIALLGVLKVIIFNVSVNSNNNNIITA